MKLLIHSQTSTVQSSSRENGSVHDKLKDKSINWITFGSFALLALIYNPRLKPMKFTFNGNSLIIQPYSFKTLGWHPVIKAYKIVSGLTTTWLSKMCITVPLWWESIGDRWFSAWRASHAQSVSLPWASCQISKIAGAHAPGMPGTFSPSSQVSDPDMHHGTCVTHVPWCMSGSLTSGFLWNWRRGETFPAFPAHAQPAIFRIW